MKKIAVKIINFILIIALSYGMTYTSHATTISDIKKDIDANQNALDGLTNSISDMEDEQDLLEEEISDLDAELLNTMAEIGLLEDSIKQKEEEIAVTQSEYEAAKAREEAQYAAMVSRIQFMYETGETGYLTALLSVSDFGEALNQAMYIEAIYEYDRKMLTEFEATRVEVKLIWDQLENEKQVLKAEEEKLQEQSVYLEGLLAKKRQESANFDAQIARAKQEANALKVKIKQEQAELKKLQEAERRKAAANGKYTVSTSVSEIINNASGSELGKQIARYGCQFIGNPYVLGGTSLTKGADCSGFIYRIYADFGYAISRTSYQQRSVGKEVEYKDAQPGDIICYEGHVALYIGGGYVVHASSAKTGIKVSKAAYRSILAVRRVL